MRQIDDRRLVAEVDAGRIATSISQTSGSSVQIRSTTAHTHQRRAPAGRLMHHGCALTR